MRAQGETSPYYILAHKIRFNRRESVEGEIDYDVWSFQILRKVEKTLAVGPLNFNVRAIILKMYDVGN